MVMGVELCGEMDKSGRKERQGIVKRVVPCDPLHVVPCGSPSTRASPSLLPILCCHLRPCPPPLVVVIVQLRGVVEDGRDGIDIDAGGHLRGICHCGRFRPLTWQALTWLVDVAG